MSCFPLVKTSGFFCSIFAADENHNGHHISYFFVSCLYLFESYRAFSDIRMVQSMPTLVSRDQPVVAIVTRLYCEKLAVDAMIENKITYVRYKTEGESQQCRRRDICSGLKFYNTSRNSELGARLVELHCRNGYLAICEWMSVNIWLPAPLTSWQQAEDRRTCENSPFSEPDLVSGTTTVSSHRRRRSGLHHREHRASQSGVHQTLAERVRAGRGHFRRKHHHQDAR